MKTKQQPTELSQHQICRQSIGHQCMLSAKIFLTSLSTGTSHLIRKNT